MNQPLRSAITVLTLVCLPVTNAAAADMSIEQVGAALRAASPSKPADLAGRSLSDLDLSGLDFPNDNLCGTSFLWSRCVQADMRGAKVVADLPGADLSGAQLCRSHGGRQRQEPRHAVEADGPVQRQLGEGRAQRPTSIVR